MRIREGWPGWIIYKSYLFCGLPELFLSLILCDELLVVFPDKLEFDLVLLVLGVGEI
jgi:hypothetical protein